MFKKSIIVIFINALKGALFINNFEFYTDIP
jgi:hypothetical protein